MAPPGLVISLFATTLLLLGGCTGEPPRVAVSEQWTEAMRRLDMLGMYPMGEDVQIGDVFLIAPRATMEDRSATPRFRNLRIGRAPRVTIEAMLRRQESERIAIRWQAAARSSPTSPAPTAPTATATITGGGSATIVARPATAPRPATAQTSRQPQPRPPFVVREVGNDEPDAPRLRRLAVPALVAATVTQGQVGAAGPIADIAGAVGLGGSRQAAVTIRLRNLASLSVDQDIAEQFLADYRREWVRENLTPAKLLRHIERLDRSAAELVCRGDAGRLENRGLVIALANTVVYAGRIEYEFSRSTTTALLGGANLAALFAQVSPASVPTVAGAVPAAVAGAPDTGALIAQLRATQEALAQSLPTTAGARISLGIGSYGGLSLNEDYPVPVAVGIGAPIYYSVSRSVLASGRTQAEADTALEGGLRACALVLRVEWRTAHSAANPPAELMDLRELICTNSEADRLRESIANPGLPAAPAPSACLPADDRRNIGAAEQPSPRNLGSRAPLPPSTVSPAEFLARGR